MSGGTCLLVQTGRNWLISRANVADWEEVADQFRPDDELLAARVEAYARDRGIARAEIVVALDARETLAATLVVDPRDARHRTTLRYELENHLPWSAEETVADFVVHDSLVLGVAARTDRWTGLIEALETKGLAVSSMGPLAILGAQDCREEDWFRHADGLVWRDEGVVHVLRLRDGRPCGWQWHADEAEPIAAEIRSHSKEPDDELPRWIVVNGDDMFVSSIDSLDCAVQRVETEPLREHARRIAADLLTGRQLAWVELRRGELARGAPHRAVRRAAAVLAAALLLLAVSWFAALGWKTLRNHARAAELDRQQAEVYRDLFPGKRVPPAVAARLRSEHARRFAARRIPSSVHLPTPALTVLRDFLQSLPKTTRVHVRELRIENGSLDLHADLRRHADATELAEALRAHHFEVPPPSTEQNSDHSVSVRLFAQWQEPKPPPGREVEEP